MDNLNIVPLLSVVYVDEQTLAKIEFNPFVHLFYWTFKTNFRNEFFEKKNEGRKNDIFFIIQRSVAAALQAREIDWKICEFDCEKIYYWPVLYGETACGAWRRSALSECFSGSQLNLQWKRYYLRGEAQTKYMYELVNRNLYKNFYQRNVKLGFSTLSF